VDVVMARRADYESLASHLGHDGCPCGLTLPGSAEIGQRADMMYLCLTCALLTQFAPALEEPGDQLPLRAGDRGPVTRSLMAA